MVSEEELRAEDVPQCHCRCVGRNMSFISRVTFQRRRSLDGTRRKRSDEDVLERELREACASNDVRRCRRVLHHDPPPDPNAFDHVQLAAIHHAAMAGCLEIVQSLLECPELDVNLQCGDGSSALHFLVNLVPDEQRSGLYLEVLGEMLARGLDLNKSNDSGDRPLHVACTRRNLTAVKFLLDNGVDVEATNANGDHALHIVLRYKDGEEGSGDGSDPRELVKLFEDACPEQLQRWEAMTDTRTCSHCCLARKNSSKHRWSGE